MSCKYLYKGKELSLYQIRKEVDNILLDLDISAVDLLRGERLKKDKAVKRNNGNPLNLAPNGKPSVLYQSYKDLGYSDSEAEKLTAQVYSDSFKAWSNNWNNLLLDDNGQPKLFYHSSKSKDITKFNATVSNDDFSKGGFFVTPKQGWDFNRTGIEYSLFVGENEDAIFDIENKEHVNKYVDYVYDIYKSNLGKITKKDIHKIIIFDGKNTLYSIFEDRYEKELNKYSERYKDEPLFDEEGDFYRTKTSKEFAIEDLQNYFDKKNELSLVLNTLNDISRRHLLSINYINLERNGDIFEKIGFKGSYVFEAKIKNIHLYNTDRVKSATENTGTFSEESNDIRYQIIGEKGASKIEETLNLLDQAKQLENVGEDEKVIEQKTGWFKQNGDWKYFSKETLNSMFPTKAFINKAKIGQEYKLEELLGSNKLFEYYPQLKDIKLKIYDGTKEQSVGLRNSEASYDRGLLLLNVFDNRGNGINPFDNAEQGKSKQSIINDRENFWANKILPLVHEIQHIIQETENFPMGGNPFTIERVARKLSNSPEGIPFSKFLQNVEDTLKENKNLSKEDLGVLNAQKRSLEFFMKSGSRSDLPQQYKMLFGEFEARTIEYIKQKYTGNNEKLYTEIQDELALIESIKQEELIPIRKTSSNLKIEVKEVNGRLVVEPLVNGTKAGALRMLPYEDGYRVDSVAVYDKYQNKRLGTRLYQEAIKFLLKSQTPLYSLKVRSENAKKIWDKFVAIGVAQKVGEDYIAPNKGGLDKNNEAAPSDVMQYANTTDEKLSKEETAEAIDLAASLGVESSQEVVAILKDAFLENDSFVFDKKKMKKAGYNDYEITKILTDVNLQNRIKNNLAKLENTDFSVPLMDVQALPEIGIFGKQKVKPKVKTVNVKTVNEQGEVVDKVSDTKELLRKTYPDTLPNDMPQIASSLLKSSENVVNTHNELFYKTLNDLKDAALDLGVDLKDIENRVFPLENFKSFVNSLMNYYSNPSDAFAEVYDEFFENYEAEKATKPTMSTPYTEYELFDKFNLVRKGDEYVKVEDVEIEPSAERQAKISQLEVEDFAVDFYKLEKLVYHKEQLGSEMKTLQKPLVEEINLREVKKNPYLKATSEGVKLVSEDPLTAQKAELYGYEPKVAEKQPKKIETDYSLVQDVLVTQLTSKNKVRTPKGNFTKFMDDNNKSVFLLDGSKQSIVDLEGYLSKADSAPKIEAKKLYSKEEYEENFGCV